MEPAPRAVLLPSLLAAALVAGCGDANLGPSPYDTRAGSGGSSASASDTFSEIELAVILSELGSLPATPPPDPSNQWSTQDAAATLGQALFFDTRYSPNQDLSCATCHDPARGFQDARANTSLGLDFTPRHAPTLFNVAYGSGAANAALWQFWDGRKDSLWSQALAPAENPNEMGSTRSKVALLVYDEYRASYEAIFGHMPALRDDRGAPLAPETALPGSNEWDALSPEVKANITQVFVNFGKVVAAYEARLISRRSRFDFFYDELSTGSADSDQLSPTEKAGLKLFVGRGRCISCHRGPNLTDWKFHNTGLAQTGPHVPTEDEGRKLGVLEVQADEFNCQSQWSDRADKSACAINALSARAADLGAFKTPGLRSVASTAPYFHTGALATLVDVVEFYDRGGDDSGFSGAQDRNVTRLNLSASEKQALVAFLNALDGKALDPALITPPARP